MFILFASLTLTVVNVSYLIKYVVPIENKLLMIIMIILVIKPVYITQSKNKICCCGIKLSVAGFQ